MAKAHPGVQWIDNFSKVYNLTKQDYRKGTYSSCLWSGICNRKYTGEAPVDMSLQYDDRKQIIPGTPKELFDCEDAFMSRIKQVDDGGVWNSLSADQRIHLSNIQSLCEFFIPVVIILIV